MNILFNKYSANGNDFILIETKFLPKKQCTPNLIAHLCDRRLGVGADGLLLISQSKNCDFYIDYYNSDGSWETFCANGSRCAAKYMFNNKLVKKQTFETGACEHNFKINANHSVTMSMKIPLYEIKKSIVLEYSGAAIDSGARHFVLESKNLTTDFVLNVAKKIRNSNQFKPRGINVNLYKILDLQTVQIKTYEKGIEGVMTSCSSGSAAVVFHLAQAGLIISPTTTISDGGKLIYKFNKNWEYFSSTGPAHYCFSGNINL